MSERVLLLGHAKPLYSWLYKKGDSVVHFDKQLTVDFVKMVRPTFLVSYGYRHIVKPEILEMFPDRAVNLHISYLPWNKGADPNFWSWIDHTPKGVTIHYMDAGVDTGDIIAQKRVEFDWDKNHTLRTTYEILNNEIQTLFKQYWPSIKEGTCPRSPQVKKTGSYHRAKDKESLEHLFTEGWDTPISVIDSYKL